MAEKLTISAAHGRVLEVELSGPPDGRALVAHHGTPDAGMMFGPLVSAGAERGLRHIAYSRPGYGGSTRNQGRAVADCAADVAAILDHLGIERFLTIGVSGGGPHALACAALLAERADACATIGGVAPFPANGLDWLAGMGNENLAEFAAVQAGAAALTQYLEQQRTQLESATAQQLIASLGDLVSEPDRQALSGELGDHLAASGRHGLKPGIWGWFDDDVAFATAWGFELDCVAVPVTIWQGCQDRFVPHTHGRWLADHVAGATAQLRPEHGHLSLAVGAYGEILDDLLANAARL